VLQKCFGNNNEIALNVSGNMGDLGGLRRSNCFSLWCGLFTHYNQGGVYVKCSIRFSLICMCVRRLLYQGWSTGDNKKL